MNRKSSKVITSLLLLALLLSPITILTTCRGSPARNIEGVSPDDWFYRYVVAGLRFGIIANESGGRFRFEPDEDVTLDEFVTMLGRLHEYGHGTIGTPGDGLDYERYFEWAVERGIILAHPDWDGLTPCTRINREQKAALVMKYILVYDLDDYFQLHYYGVALGTFWEHSQMSLWGRAAVEMLRLRLMISARYGMFFRPQDSVSRAEALQIIIRVGSAVYDLVHPLMMK